MTNITVRQPLRCKVRKYLLFLSWCIGLLLGVSAAANAGSNLPTMIRSATLCPVSIPGLLASTVFPFLCSAYAVSFSEPWLLLPISTLKAFSFSFCAFGVNLAFGSAGWLVRLLFLFSDACVIPLLFFYWLRHFDNTPAHPDKELLGCIIAAIAIGAADYCLVSPFLVELINF